VTRALVFVIPFQTFGHALLFDENSAADEVEVGASRMPLDTLNGE
jgi:hypothetical protein